MTLGDVATKARNLTNTDTSSYTDANLLIDINIWYQKVGSIIYDSQDDSDFDDQRRTDYPMQTTPFIVTGGIPQRDYSFGVNEKVLKYKRVDITYDGVTWVRALPLDDGSYKYGMGDDSTAAAVLAVDQYFSTAAPRYDVKYGSLFIYPTATSDQVAAGAKIRAEWERNVTPFITSDYTSVLTDSTVVPGFDDPFHPILAYGAAFEYASSRQLPQLAEIQPQLQDWEARLRQAYGKKDLDVRVSLGTAYDDYSFS